MSEVQLPKDFIARFKDMERRLRILEQTPRLNKASVRDGRTIFQDGDGNIVVLLGAIEDGVYGELIISKIGWPLSWYDNQHGQIYPGETINFANATSLFPCTSGSFVPTFNAAVLTATSEALAVSVPWTTDVGTTGEVRLNNFVLGGAVTSARSLPANSSGIETFCWLHQQPVGSTPFRPRVDARRTGGAGNVNIFEPYIATMSSAAALAAAGMGTATTSG
jgi:hypothetical protein